MDHFDEYTLELFVLRSAAVNPAQRSQIESHLNVCNGCRALVELFRSFYEEFRAYPRLDTSAVDILMQRLYPREGVMILHQFHVRPRIPANGVPYTTVLAAMTDSTGTQPRFETLATLASEKDKSLVRIHHDRQTNKFKIYFHAEDAAKQQGAIVSLPELPADFVLDDNGQVEFDLAPDHVPADWRLVSAVIRTPQLNLPLRANSFDAEGVCRVEESTEMGRFLITLSHRRKQFAITCQCTVGKGQEATRAIIKPPEGEAHMIVLDEGRGSMVMDHIPDQFTLRLYA